jgi:hypothetical protein
MCITAILKISILLYYCVTISIKFAYLIKHRSLAWKKSVNVYANGAFVTLHAKRFKHGDGASIRCYIIRRTAATGKYNSTCYHNFYKISEVTRCYRTAFHCSNFFSVYDPQHSTLPIIGLPQTKTT